MKKGDEVECQTVKGKRGWGKMKEEEEEKIRC